MKTNEHIVLNTHNIIMFLYHKCVNEMDRKVMCNYNVKPIILDLNIILIAFINDFKTNSHKTRNFMS